ncbi:leucine-rich repeat receptor-like serine/threonine-protein kinase At2g14510 [Cornus florida]|uniref:leucine-rich repeat receptor-like serine/threonine-protein kinase At2g14510 n=1 Tax=Cornus florida TaxID=4283 RepID=UPI00289F76CA|nr:leucine-rich repeat receptor-like serine/threonine-protein kinase At2g14510 [Cornus florida]
MHAHKWHWTKCPKRAIFICIFILITTFNFAVSQPTSNDCVLNLGNSSWFSFSSCEGGDWGGFLYKKCCGGAFQEYLYALGQRANQTGQIYLDSTEQSNCLNTKHFEDNVLSCGIEKLTSGGGGCSGFSINDVHHRLRDNLRSLKEKCELVSSGDDWDQSCGSCMKSWEDIHSNNSESTKDESDICRFAVLVTLTSSRIEDETRVRKIYQCLGQDSDKVRSMYCNQQANLFVHRILQTGEHKRSIKIGTGICILIGGILGLVAIVLILYLSKRWCKSTFLQEKDASKCAMPKGSGNLAVPIKEVYSATNNLNELNFIGEGTAGKVYKGTLSNKQHVAVKHIINDGYVETFVREVRSLSYVRHPNLVALLGYCENKKECFLIYELCPNGNLSEWLFGKKNVLSWIQRLEIAIDSATGLWFLHTFPERCIVHRDIKPTNILLGTNFEAKLSDFGLSKVIELGEAYASSEVRGTFGYVDPEYQSNHQVNPLGDIYSFGVVLLQILSGKKVINMNMNKPLPLNKLAKSFSRVGSISTGFADPKLDGNYSAEAFDLTLKLALSCTALRQHRPSMEQVVIQLKEALDISTKASSSPHHSTQDLS